MIKDNQKSQKGIGKRIQDIRTALNLKQEELATRLQCSRSNLSQVDASRKKFNVSVDWLLSGQGSMFIHEKEKELYLPDFGKDSNEIKQMLKEMKKSPVLKHRVFSDFFSELGLIGLRLTKREVKPESTA